MVALFNKLLTGGTSEEAKITKIKIKIKVEHALSSALLSGLSTSDSSSSSCHLVIQIVTAIEQSEPAIAGSSAPTNLAAIIWGIAIANPDIKVMRPTPLIALTLPPVKITKINGTSTTKIHNCNETRKDNAT